MVEFKSLRELREELTGVRLGAADTSLWSLGATINDRARVAINEALDTYPMHIRGMYYSALLHAGPPIILPSNVRTVISIKTWNQSNYPSVNITNYKHVPTIMTNFLYIYQMPRPTLEGYGLEMEVEYIIRNLKEDVALDSVHGVAADGFTVSGNSIVGVWPSQGFLEISAPPHIDTSQREVVRYEAISPGRFTNVTRAVVGEAQSWTTGSVVSAVMMLPERGLGVIEKAAQANMYQYWVSHRAQYDRYVSLVGVQEIDLPSLLTLVRSLEAEADRKYKRMSKRVPAPAQLPRKGRRS